MSGAVPPFDVAKVCLRPIAANDLELLRGWRNLDRVRSRMFDSATITAEAQRAWWRRRENDAHYRQFVLSYDGRPLGSISFTTGDDPQSALCGYYIGAEPAPARSGTLLMYAGLRHAYGSWGLREVTCEILAGNEPSIGLVRRFGFRETGRSRSQTGDRRPCRVFQLHRDEFAAAEPLVRALIFEAEVTSAVG